MQPHHLARSVYEVGGAESRRTQSHNPEGSLMQFRSIAAPGMRTSWLEGMTIMSHGSSMLKLDGDPRKILFDVEGLFQTAKSEPFFWHIV